MANRLDQFLQNPSKSSASPWEGQTIVCGSKKAHSIRARELSFKRAPQIGRIYDSSLFLYDIKIVQADGVPRLARIWQNPIVAPATKASFVIGSWVSSRTRFLLARRAGPYMQLADGSSRCNGLIQ
jgi:hypothetical protein